MDENQPSLSENSDNTTTIQSSVKPSDHVPVDDGSNMMQAPVVDNLESSTQHLKLRIAVITLGVLQLIGAGIFLLVIGGLIAQAKAGASGTEFVALILGATVVPGVGLIALINLIVLPIYISKCKLHGKGLALVILSLVVSLFLAAYGAYSFYQIKVALPREAKKLSEQSKQKIQQHVQQFQTDNASPQITDQQAIQLLQACQLKGFYYTKQTDKSGGGWGELSTTGVVLTKINGKPYRISIADRLIPELVPIARKAQLTCGGPQFWHDGNYEQWSNGAWYFNKVKVNPPA